MRRGSGINKGTDPEQSAKRVGCAQHESTQPHKTQQQIQHLRGGGGPGGPGLSRGGPGGLQEGSIGQQHPGFCAGGYSTTRGSGPPPRKVKPPKCQGSVDTNYIWGIYGIGIRGPFTGPS